MRKDIFTLFLLLVLLAGSTLPARSLSGVAPSLRVSSAVLQLPNDELRCLHFDRQGRMLIGTNTGLKSFDGYTVSEGEGLMDSGLNSADIICMAEQPGDTLWLGTHDGLYRLDRQTGRLTHYRLPKKSQQIVYALFVSREGTLYVGTDDGFSIYNKVNDTFRNFDAEHTVALRPDGRRENFWGYSVKAFVETSGGDIVMGTWGSGLLRYSPATETFHAYARVNPDNSAYSLCMDTKGNLWIGTWRNGVQRINSPDDYTLESLRTVVPPAGLAPAVYHLAESPADGTLWACTNGGVCLIHPDETVEQVATVGPYSLSNLRRVLPTEEGCWLMTQTGTVVRVQQSDSPFCHLLPGHRIRSVFAEDDSRLWVGNGLRGVACCDLSTGKVSYNREITVLASLDDDDADVPVTDILRRRNGELWMAAAEEKAFVSRPDGMLSVLSSEESGWIWDNVQALYESADSILWVGQRMGLSVLLPNGEKRHLDVRNETADLTGYFIVNHITEDNLGNLWVSSLNRGVLRLSGDPSRPDSLRLRFYSPVQGNLPTANVTACLADSRGRVWAISGSHGLLRYEPAADRFVTADPATGRVGRKVLAAVEDVRGDLWLATDRTLTRLTVADDGTFDLCSFTADDGLPNTMFYPNAVHCKGDTLYFGTADGVIAFSPTAVTETSSAPVPSLVLTGFSVDGTPLAHLGDPQAQTVCDRPVAFARMFTIPPTVRRFSVEFALPVYTGVSEIRYAYRLRGFDEAWTSVEQGQHSASFANLPAGRYTLEVQAVDAQGRRSGLPHEVTVRVLSPWYFTWWAWLIYVVVALAVARLVYVYLKMRREVRAGRRFSTILRSVSPRVESDPNAAFINRAMQLVMAHLDDAAYNRDRLAADLGMSVSTLYTRLHELTGVSIQTYIQSIRLNAACGILKDEPSVRISDLAYRVGFNTPKYFSQCFKKEFGLLPGEYVREHQAKVAADGEKQRV